MKSSVVFGSDEPSAPARPARAAAAPAPAAAAPAAAAATDGEKKVTANGVPLTEFTGGTVSGKINAKFTKSKDERDLRFGTTDPGLFGSTTAPTGKAMPKRGGAAATNNA